MTDPIHPSGTLVRYREGSRHWAEEKTQGRPHQVFEVMALVDDGTGVQRIRVRALGAIATERFAYDAALFERAEINPRQLTGG